MTDELYLVYIIELNDGSLYTGITNNLQNRIKTHISGMGSKYVRSRLPIKKTYSTDKTMSKSEASKLEYKIKQLPKKEKLNELRLHKNKE